MLGFNKFVQCVAFGFFLFKIFVEGAPPLLGNQSIQNDEITSTVVDMNSSNNETSAILNQFNISMEDVERRISQIDDSKNESSG